MTNCPGSDSGCIGTVNHLFQIVLGKSEKSANNDLKDLSKQAPDADAELISRLQELIKMVETA